MVARSRLVLGSRSAAEDLAFIALTDVADVVAERGVREWRVIGGHMVMLHVSRYDLGAHLYRTTADADLGVPPFVVRTAGLVEALEDRGYTRSAGNRFTRVVPELRDRFDAPRAVVDVLVPAYTSHARENRVISEKLTTTEVPGLAFALARDPVNVEVDVSLWTGGERSLSLQLPDEVSAFVLKSFSWRERAAGKDAVDVWRVLEALVAGGIQLAASESKDVADAVAIALEAFRSSDSPGARALRNEQRLSVQGVGARVARIQALLKRVAIDVS